MAYSKPRSPHNPFHPNTTAPRTVGTARNVIEQCIDKAELDRAEVKIGFGQLGDDVPALRDGERLFTDQEIEALVTAASDQSDSLVNILVSENVEKEYEDKVRVLLEQVLQKWKSVHLDAPPMLQTVTVRPKRTLPELPKGPEPLQLHTSENAVKRTTYERGLEDIEIGVVVNGKERTILVIEMKRHYRLKEYPTRKSGSASATSDKQSLLDVVNQCVMYSMKTQRAVLYTGKNFVLVSMVLFKEAAFLIKLTANDWWSYLYKLDVRKYKFQDIRKEHAEEDKLQRARDVVNMLQMLVSRVLVVNTESNALFSDTLHQDFTQVEPPNYRVQYPSYPPDAHVRALPNVRANHIRMCSLVDCAQTLIRHSVVHWPILDDLDMDKDEWCSQLEQDVATQVVTKVVSALNYDCSSGPKFVAFLHKFLSTLKSRIRQLERAKSERAAKYKNILDLHVCVTSRKENKKSAVVVTMFKGDSVRAHANFLLDWKNRTGGAKEAFFDQVCDVCIGMLEDGLPYYHGDLRPANIAVFMTQEAKSTGTGADASTKLKATGQNGYVLTVIDWEDVRVSGIFETNIKGDNFYPYARCTSATEQLASAAYTAYQLLLCIYILHRVAKTCGADDSFVKANEVEFNLRYCKPIFTTKELAHASEVKQMRLEDTPTTSTDASAIDANFLLANPTPEEQEKRAEYDSFQKWITKMCANVSSDVNAFLTDQSQCDQSTFGLLRNHLKVAICTDLHE